MSRARWFALYSQTGSELTNVCARVAKTPDLILTNNPDAPRLPDSLLESAMYAPHKSIMRILAEELKPDDIVTLHGYLRILPKEVLDTGATILNGHPGLITMYPELKGKDPQKKVEEARDTYQYLGCVLHEVTEEVDEGEVVGVMMRVLHPDDDIIAETRRMSEELWVRLIEEEFYV